MKNKRRKERSLGKRKERTTKIIKGGRERKKRNERKRNRREDK